MTQVTVIRDKTGQPADKVTVYVRGDSHPFFITHDQYSAALRSRQRRKQHIYHHSWAT